MAANKETLVSPLTAAMGKDNDGTLRTLLDHGMDAVGRTQAKESAVCDDRAKNLDALLGHFEGDDETRRYLTTLSERWYAAIAPCCVTWPTSL